VGPVEEVLQNPQHPYTKILKWATLPIHPDDARRKLEEETPLRAFEAPDISNPPPGCRFHTRCPKARQTCVERVPPLMSNGDGVQEAACFRQDPDHEYWQSSFLDEEGEMELPN